MKKRNLLLVILAIMLVFGMVVGCGDDLGDDGGEATLLSVTANGDGLASTTALTLTFDQAISGLAASHITLGSGATKGTLSGSGPTYTLGVSGVTADANVSVTVSRSGWTISGSPKTVAVKYSAAGKAAKYFQGYNSAYYLGSGASAKQINERIKFEKNKLVIWDTSVDSKVNYIEFEITKWDDAVTPTWTLSEDDVSTIIPANFKVAFKLTGKIKGGYPFTAATSTTPANIYGGKTAPNFTQADITNETTAYMFLYICDDDDVMDLTLLRSIFTKTGGTGSTADKDKEPITSSKGPSSTKESIRVYPQIDAINYYPDYTGEGGTQSWLIK